MAVALGDTPHVQPTEMNESTEAKNFHPEPSSCPVPSYLDEDEDLNMSSNSAMTTKELQEFWRNVKNPKKPVKLLFEIPSARIEEQQLSKYVMYKIVVIKSGSYDDKKVSIERRYSDFERLHQNLLKDFSEEMEGIFLPRKRLTSNFNPEAIRERKAAFKEYLGSLYSFKCIRWSFTFMAFFTRPELKEAHSCLRGGDYAKAAQLLLPVIDLHEKVTQHNPKLLVPTLCALLICYKDMEDSPKAFEVGERALSLLCRNRKHRYKCPLLVAQIDLGYELGFDITDLQAELSEIQATQLNEVSLLSLKELVIQEFTD
ncbi:sorting nexin-20 [Erpetoichthys calabaricus]|uniref:Sorting nexin 20 n=1 Tax=Erpetoichthys calabaricus TaxID=27687 RepID=A0A8C4SR18_ERPCA|nr:sorting nexin-20 [Erpetoichthys calabaricus]XP_051788043.1 sorting nexin-20 [Erpetoichthys calabaricus]